MENVVITGATGMLGVALINKCIEQDVRVLAIIRPNSKNKNRIPENSLVTIVEAELGDYSCIQRKEQYDVFYHLGWGHTTKEGRNDETLQNKNVEFTIEAIRLAKRLGCKTFVGAGSQAEYGIVTEKIGPGTQTNPVTAYGKAKLQAFMKAKELCDQLGINLIWPRIFSLYGPYDRKETLINFLISQFNKGEVAKVSAGTQNWDYLYVTDAAEMFYRFGTMKVASGVYCVASGETRPLKEFILEMKDMFGSDAKVEFGEETNVPMVSLNVDISKTNNTIDFTQRVSFREGIADIINGD